MAPRSLKNSKATFWGVKDRERYGAGREGHGEGSGGSKWKKREQKKGKIKKPLCFYAKRLSRESSGQLGQWHDWRYMCLDDFLPKRLWFSCLSSLLHPHPHSASLCVWRCEWVCASGGTATLLLPVAQHHTASFFCLFIYLFLTMLMQQWRCRDNIKLMLLAEFVCLSGSQLVLLKLLETLIYPQTFFFYLFCLSNQKDYNQSNHSLFLVTMLFYIDCFLRWQAKSLWVLSI